MQPEPFLSMSAADRTEALGVAAGASGRPQHLLEKDVWVVWALQTLFAAPYGAHLVFKGGTSLSKAYRAIRRFSEDVDLTYDVRELAGDLVGSGPEPIPESVSKAKKLTEKIRDRLTTWVRDVCLASVRDALAQQNLGATAALDPNNSHCIRIAYDRATDASSYVSPVVVLEFGARSTGEPVNVLSIGCDAAVHLAQLRFPETTARVMRVERTFWEKATAIHVVCKGGRLRKERFSRHWYDLVKLDEAGHVEAALKSREVALQVAKHKQMFFPEKGGDARAIDYTAAVSGELRLVPDEAVQKVLGDDFAKMAGDGLLEEAPMPFSEILHRCSQIAARANAPVP